MNLGDRKKLLDRIRALKETAPAINLESKPTRSDTGQSEGEGVYLLDGRNIACEGGARRMFSTRST